MVSLANPYFHIWKRDGVTRRRSVCEADLVVDEPGEIAMMSAELRIKQLIALVPRNRVDKLCR